MVVNNTVLPIYQYFVGKIAVIFRAGSIYSLYSSTTHTLVREGGGVAVPAGTNPLRWKSVYFRATDSLDVTKASA